VTRLPRRSPTRPSVSARKAQRWSHRSRSIYDEHADDIKHVTADVVGVRPIEWQNRPTFQQVVAFTGHRARG
jgi:hypothetical protein